MNFKKLVLGLLLSSSFFHANTGFAQHTCTERMAHDHAPDGVDRLAGDLSVFWEAGQTIRIKFIGGSSYLRNKVKEYANQWTKYANIKFNFVGDNEKAEVRISFNPGGSWSYLGTQCKYIAADKATMNFGWFNENTSDNEFSRTTIHEFGHMLGLIHEHLHPDAGIPWNKPVVYEDYARTQGWSKATVDNALFKKYDHNRLQKSNYDKYSIMHYAISNKHTIGDYEVGWNTKLSDMDMAFVGEIYPFSNTSSHVYPSNLATGWYGIPFSKVDAALNYPEGRCYIFSGDKYVRWDHDGEAYLTPKSIQNNWEGVSFSKIDAAFYWKPNNKVYFFSGSKYIRYDVSSAKADAGYPRDIVSNWGDGNMFTSIDAALPWDENKVYFFKDNQYLRFDFNENVVDNGYPKELTHTSWNKVSFNHLDAIVPWAGSILYMFKGSQYHRFDIEKNTAY